MRRKIGRTGVEVFAIGMGVMPLSLSKRPSEKEAIAVIQSALVAGINFFDTADVYCIDDRDMGHNECLLSKALGIWGNRSSIYTATKGGLTRPGGDWVTNGKPRHLRQACEKSLKNLGTESIFLYQLHAPDDRNPFEDSVGELARLKEEGKIEHIGISNVSREEFVRAQKVARIETVQNRCNVLTQRDFQNGLIEACAQEEITFIPHSPVGGYWGHREVMQGNLFQGLAQKYRVSPYQIALRWLLAKGEHILPIPGASRAASIQDSAESVCLDLKREDISLLDSLGT